MNAHESANLSETRPDDAIAELASPPRGKRWLQLAGFLVGIGLLVWCLMEAFKQENRAKLAMLRDASATDIAWLALLASALLVLDGAIFWIIIRPVKRLDFLGVQSTNVVATLLGPLPFKIGMLFRLTAHTRRDQVPLATIAAWFATFAGLMLVAIGPLIAATLMFKKIDARWGLVGAGFVILATAMVIGFARLFRGEAGLTRLKRLAKPVPPIVRLLDTKLWRQVHACFEMQSNVVTVVGAVVFRLAYLGAQAGLFLVAARMLAIPLDAQQAVLLATAYYVIGAASPVGQLGARESGTAAIALAMGIGDVSQFTVIPLFVTTAALIAQIPLAAAGLIYLRPDRWLAARGKPATPKREPPAGAGPSPEPV